MKNLKRTDDLHETTPSPAAHRLEALKAAGAALRRPAALQVAEQGLKVALDRREACNEALIAAIQGNFAQPDGRRDNTSRAINALEAELVKADQAANAAGQTLSAERAKWAPTFRAFLLHFQAEAGREIVAAIEMIDAALPLLRAAEGQLVRQGMEPPRRVIAPDLEYLRELAEKFAGALS